MLYLRDAIDRLLEKPNYSKYLQYLGFKRETVSNLLKMLQEEYRGKALEQEKLSEAIKNTVKSYSRDKCNAIKIFIEFLSFLEKELAFKVEIDFPKIDISNSFERLMYLAKVLQHSNKTTYDLSEELWVGERTIEEDLLRLRGKDPIQICGKQFIINETQRKNGKFSFASTVHPFFLTLNLTQVMSVLKGLRFMCNDPGLKRYATLSAAAIWQQLSDYAKERIIYVTTNLMPDEIEWYRKLDEFDINAFNTEYECRTIDGAGVIIDCIKNDKPFFLECLKEDGHTYFLNNCRVVPMSYDGKSVRVVCDEGDYQIMLDSVLRSAYTIDELV